MTEFFHAATADLISAAQFARGFTKRGVNHGNIPIKSYVTKICPSQPSPLPMPMVGMGTRAGHFLGNRRRHQFEHNRERTRFRQRLRISQQSLVFRLRFCL